MTVKTLCEVCKKTIGYTNPEQQVQEAIDNPDQFCEGHITEPNQDAIKTIMAILRNHKNPDNCFFISMKDGRLISHAYMDRKSEGYFPSIPKNSYEIGISKKQSKSYAVLGEYLHAQWRCIAEEASNYMVKEVA
jgi:hypothetical protein